MLPQGLYEQVINAGLGNKIDQLTNIITQTAPIDKAEASKILAKYLAEVIEKGLNNLQDKGGDMQAQIGLANKIIQLVNTETQEDSFKTDIVDQRAELLLALLETKNSIYAINKKAVLPRPQTSLAQSSLFTGAAHEPHMFTELKKEILSSDRIDMLVSFIKWSGLRLIMDSLQQFTAKGGKLRVITTSYLGATDLKAIEELRNLPHTEIKISYDTQRTRLHAKAYMFYRETGFTTAYVGSSNLSHAAISDGLEWNVKVTKKDLPATIKKITATFESYWNSSEFEIYTLEDKTRLSEALQAEKAYSTSDEPHFTFAISPYTYQQEVLNKLQAERKLRGYYKNLVVAATGTGKTIISAFDYKNYCNENYLRYARLLFVAHREEILKQSLGCFRGVLKDANFGDLFVGSYRPKQLDHLFISIQTLNARDFTEFTSPDFYEFIIVDEFHHAAAPTYQKLLEYYQPKVLLGLTATPERMDGKNILRYFDNRIAAEIRLPEAIERKLLCPFHYFCVSDIVDLNTLKWTRGGYDRQELSNIYTYSGLIAEKRARLIVRSVHKYVTDINKVKGLGFCVSVEHAAFMADFFNKNNIPSICLTGNSSQELRATAKQRLIAGEIRFIFVVDIYNEGVDIPEVNTVLFLRPTESLTVFLQQLGRGLRLSENKDCLTVLDFIGQANKRYRFEEKFAALLTTTSKSIRNQLEDGFTSAPKGCYILLEKKAQAYILDNIKASFDTRKGLLARLATFSEDASQPLTLHNFVTHYRLDVRRLYTRKASFSRLCVLAGVRADFNEELEPILTKALPRICAIDSPLWLKTLLELLDQPQNISYQALPPITKRMLRMFQFTVWQKPCEEVGHDTPLAGLLRIKQCPVLCAELVELLEYKYSQIDFITEPVDLGFACPLELHCSYTRDQIFVALDYLKPSVIRQGVKWLPDKQLDVLINTLNKSEKDYSETTMYDDYSINEWLFHWQSQSTTSESSPTGQRYIHHKERGSKVLLFVREYKYDITGTAPFTFLGLANYVKHEGSRPMSIVWRLEKPIPAKFLKKSNKLVVG